MNGDVIIKVAEILVPATVAIAVGAISTIIALRQMREASDTAKQQLKAATEAAMLQYRAQVLSSNRQAWINDVRNVVSEMLAILERFRLADSREDFGFDHIERFELSRHRLRLLLNLEEAESRDINEWAKKLRILAAKNLQPPEEYASAAEGLQRSTAVVLKKEWERVKRGE